MTEKERQIREVLGDDFPPKESGATTWIPTSSLRYIKYSITNNLQQKWVETNTGAEEWREIEMV